MNQYKKLLIGLFFLAFWPISLHAASQLSTVTVIAKGFGATEPEAISDAVINGIAQVNGESVASKMRVQKKTNSSTATGTTGERSIEKDLSRRTQGVVKSWRTLTANSSSGGFTATVQVNVVVVKRSDQLKRMKLAIVSSENDIDELEMRLNDEVTTALTSSRKFAILDRGNANAVESQLQRIRSGGGIEDKARLSAEVAPDFIAVTSLTIVPKGAQQAAEGSIEIIDYATRQIKFSERKTIPIAFGTPGHVEKRIKSLAKALSRSVIETVYPPLVVGVQDDGIITIAQGEDFFSVGDKCVIREITGVLKDPHTKEFLSYQQKDVARAEIIATDKRVSLAQLGPGYSLTPNVVTEKKFLVIRDGESEADVFKMIDQTGQDETNGISNPTGAAGDDDY